MATRLYFSRACNIRERCDARSTLSLCSFAHFQAALRVASTVAHSLTSFSGSDLMIVNSRNLVSAYICSGVNFPLIWTSVGGNTGDIGISPCLAENNVVVGGASHAPSSLKLSERTRSMLALSFLGSCDGAGPILSRSAPRGSLSSMHCCTQMRDVNSGARFNEERKGEEKEQRSENGRAPGCSCAGEASRG